MKDKPRSEGYDNELWLWLPAKRQTFHPKMLNAQKIKGIAIKPFLVKLNAKEELRLHRLGASMFRQLICQPIHHKAVKVHCEIKFRDSIEQEPQII